MKKLLCFVLLSTLSITTMGTISAQKEVADGFEGVEIVTKDTYKPIQSNVPEESGNAAMGSQPRPRARSASPVWKNENGYKNFYNGLGSLMYHQGTKKIVDVSEHNKVIDWDRAKASGIDGVILRVGWGDGGLDLQFKRNIAECNRLGIPYGLYLYSYAYDANFAYAEANGTAAMLKEVNVNLSYPIYYDIENFIPWNDHGTTRRPPSSVAGYESVIGTYISRMNELGYSGKVHVYSYRSMLQNVLNSPRILQYVSWAAEYGSNLNFTNTHYNGVEGWQYTSSEHIDGIPDAAAGVDVSCFSGQMFGSLSSSIPESISSKLSAQGLTFNGGYVTGFSVGSNLNGIVDSLKQVGNVTCYNKADAIINGSTLATGQRISINIKNGEQNEVFNIMAVIRGDVNGDGKISALDYVKIRNKMDGRTSLSGYEMQGADANHDGRISAIDYVKIRNKLDGKSNIEQK